MGKSQEVAVREDAGTISVPEVIAKLGVTVQQHGSTRVVVFPTELKKKVNVLLPVAQVTQADPNWTPSIRVVELDEPTHTYNNAAWGRKARALRKEGLELLAEAAGIVMSKPRVVPREELLPDEAWAFEATIGIRRSDGTVEWITRRRGWNEVVERDKIEQAVSDARGWDNQAKRRTNQKKFGEPGSEPWKAEVRKRWNQEREYGPAKTESKAVLRAIRAALHVRQQYDEAEVKRPWVVVGYSFTPDYDDPATREILMRHGLAAGAQLYGQAAELEQRAGDGHPVIDVQPSDEAPDGNGDEDDDERPLAEPGDDQEPLPGTENAKAEKDGDPYEDEPEPPAEEEPKAEAAADDGVEAARSIKMTGGKFADQTLGELADGGQGWYLKWIAANFREDDVREAAALLVDHYDLGE